MTLKKILLALLAISLLLFSCKVKKQDFAELTAPDITANDIHWHIGALASDSMQGRMAGTPYEALAAGYIKEKFRSLGLKAFSDKYFQTVPLIYSHSYFDNCELYFEGYKGDYPVDFRPMIMFDSLTVAGAVVFAGYGNDSDYSNLDVKGKWVMVLESANSILYDKKAMAKKHGAAGLLAIGKDGTTGDERYVLPADSIPMIKISQKFSDQLLAHAGTTVSEVSSKAKTGENQSLSIPVIVHATIKSTKQQVASQNVIGYLDAGNSGQKNGYIVIGAHYDHVGTRMVHDSLQIFRGADDNASGVAGVLEIAEKLRTAKKLKYNVIFAAFGAEEMGLIGSQYFCNNPPVPLEKIKLMINMDMMGRMDSANHAYFNTVIPNAEIDGILNKIKKSHPGINPVMKLDSLKNTDYAPFYAKKIPVISFTTGLHSAYHTPADTLGAINCKGEKLFLDYIYDFLLKEEGH